MDFYDKQIGNELLVEVPVYLNVDQQFPDLVEASQRVVDSDLANANIDYWRIKLIKGTGSENDYNVRFELGEETVYTISPYSRDVMITYTLELMSAGRVPELVAGVLLDHMFRPEMDIMKTYSESLSYESADDKVVGYSPNYHLTFSLFYGGGDPVEWEIDQALEEYFTPFRKSFSRVTNFTVDTQVQYYSSIGCSPVKQEDRDLFMLDQSDLSTFVNFAEWSLSSIHPYPTLHFILYIPSEDQTPLVIKDSVTNSFLIPQWGGVVILNRLDSNRIYRSQELLPILETFSSQCLSLLGAPSLPKSPPIRIDALSRISAVRALKSASATLGSLHRLILSLPDIAIPQPVFFAVDKTIASIKSSLTALRNGEWNSAILSAGHALESSEKAFFDKMMVQQVFFPEEHKIAIYLPLLGPLAVVMLTGFVRVLREWKESRKEKKE